MKNYDHIKIEKKWQKDWETKKIYQAKNTLKGKKFYGLIEFPYPSGAGLHVGHIRSNTAMDIITRKRRMEGYNTLFPIGWDAFGLPTENYAIKTGMQPEKVTKQNTDTFRRQLKALGFGFDWSREVNTTDPAYYKWTQWIFLKFYEKGLAYKAKTTINWCPKDKIGLANEEVVNGNCERCGTPTVKKEKEQWMLAITKYADRLDKDLDDVNYLPKIKTQQRNWIGKSEGSEIDFKIKAHAEGNCIIVHGSNPTEQSSKEGLPENVRHWKAWLQRNLETKSIEVSNDLYPEDWAPNYDAWKKVFEKNTINENTILVGHSAGSAFLLRWLNENKRKINKLILVAPSIVKTDKYIKLSTLKNFTFDSSLIKYFNSITIFYSDNDMERIIESVKEIHTKLGGKLIHLKDRGHFTLTHMGTEEFPELLDEVLSATKHTQKILIGTRNEAKFRMTKECLPKIEGFEFVSLNDIAPVDDSSLVEGMDYVQNAKMKAEFYYQKTGLPTISLDNVLWLEKWKKDNGLMIHMRKEANPKSDRATDEEILTFLKKWVTKVGGKSKAHFIYAVAFANGAGTETFVSEQRGYVLQAKQSKNFWPGYPTESLLIDEKTKEYKGDQKNSVRYDVLISHLKIHAKKWFTKTDAIKVFTTRADTLYGAFAVIMAPEHELVMKLKPQIQNWKEVEKYLLEVKKKTDIERTSLDKEKTGVELKGVTAINPINNEEIPVWIADFVLVQYGTGAVFADMHDERDYEFATKYNLPMRKVVEPVFHASDHPIREDLPIVKRNAICAVIRNPKDNTYLCSVWKNVHMHGLITGGVEEGEDMIEAASREIYEETGYKNVKLVKDPDVAIHSLFYHRVKQENRHARFQYLFFDLVNEERDEVDEKEAALHDVVWKTREELEGFFSVVEGQFTLGLIDTGKYLHTGEGLLINSGEYTGMKTEDARPLITKAAGGKIVTKYKLRDWVFSRQRYWGEPIPIVHCEKCGYVPVPEKELPITLPKVKSYVPTDNGESPLAIMTKWVNTKCPTCKGPAKRETDTMPNWAGSSWYYLRYVDPKNKKEFASKKNLKYFTPVDWYNGGMEHTTLHLLYSRFWHKFLYDLKFVPTSEPYMKRTSHGMILASGGVKMSKSIGNTINPEDIIKLYGADTLRVYEMFMGPFDQAVSWDTSSIIGSRRFLEKVWRGALIAKEENVKKTDKNTEKVLHKTLKKVSEDIEAMNFNTAISSMMVLTNEIEKSKAISVADYKLYLQILSTFAPHITEELWKEFGGKGSIHATAWPKFDPKKTVDDAVTIAIQVNGKVRSEIEIELALDEEEVKTRAINDVKILPWLEGKEIKKIIYVKGRLVNIVI